MPDRIQALRLAGRLVMAWPGRNVTDDHAGAWADALEPLNDAQASRVVELLVRRSVDPPSVAQIGHTIAEVQGTTMSPDYYGGGYRCTFLDGVECSLCHVVHGRLLTRAELAEGWADLKREGVAMVVCRECGVVHRKRSHDEYVARTRIAMDAVKAGSR